MKEIEYLILGAGPSGLTLANALIQSGTPKQEIILLEKNACVGGLCRSETVDGSPLDIGGGHFLDINRKEVLNFIYTFMPREEWNTFERVSKIKIRGIEVDHPLESNLWQLPQEIQVDYLESIARAGSMQGDEMPESFADWITWKLGKQIAEEYMIPYNRKIWSMDLDLLGTYWLHKLPSVSFRETVLSCLQNKPNGSLPAHGTFLYPKHFGYGEVWRRMGVALGESLITSYTIEKIDLANRTVNDYWRAKKIITTIPWTSWPKYCDLPEEISAAIENLKFSSIDVGYFPESIDSDAHWIYEPDERISYHRILLRSNFVTNSRGYWTETNSLRSDSSVNTCFHNEFAYPINTILKPGSIKKILDWANSKGIIGLGRWGRWEHMNSDIAVSESLQMASKLCRQNP
mgnify:CR=1 FL=1